MALKLLILFVGVAGFFYLLVRKPEYIAAILFTLVIARVNFDLKGMPMNTRALVTLALFGRIIIDKPVQREFSSFLKLHYIKLLIAFLTYVLFISLWQDTFKADMLKETIAIILASFCLFHFVKKMGNVNVVKWATLASGLICFADLAYTYKVYGNFPMHRLYYILNGTADSLSDDDLDAMANWNFFGQICGMAFVYVFTDYVKNRTGNKYILLLLPVMLGGVMMSTSRSAILGLLVVSILVVLNSLNYHEQKRKVFRLGGFIVGMAIVGVLLFSAVSKLVSLDSSFLDQITSRLTDEPVAVFRKTMGLSYNVNNLGPMAWREESAENAYSAYLNLPIVEQFFGIGTGGFELRNLGHGLNAHNATLLLLIESGIFGFLLFFSLVGGTIIKSISARNVSPSLAVVCFILVYGLAQNRDWTSFIMCLYVVCNITELEMLKPAKKSRQPILPPRTTETLNIQSR
ncbi:MAG TPA: O-antigen ligase family protein [Puia sp.]|nr:O-antigen ligase family protein [Puia sp.]